MKTVVLSVLIISVTLKTLVIDGTKTITNVFHAYAIVVLNNALRLTVVQELVPILPLLVTPTNLKNLVPTQPIFVVLLKYADVMSINVWLTSPL
jgi:hypothetical protein